MFTRRYKILSKEINELERKLVEVKNLVELQRVATENSSGRGQISIPQSQKILEYYKREQAKIEQSIIEKTQERAGLEHLGLFSLIWQDLDVMQKLHAVLMIVGISSTFGGIPPSIGAAILGAQSSVHGMDAAFKMGSAGSVFTNLGLLAANRGNSYLNKFSLLTQNNHQLKSISVELNTKHLTSISLKLLMYSIASSMLGWLYWNDSQYGEDMSFDKMVASSVLGYAVVIQPVIIMFYLLLSRMGMTVSEQQHVSENNNNVLP